MENEKQRERLVELLKNADTDEKLQSYDLYDLVHDTGGAEYFADYLLANNVVVLPCKVGDTLYVITQKVPCYACICCSDFCHKDCKIKDKSKLVVKKSKVDAISFLYRSNEIHIEIDGSKQTHSYSSTYYFDDFGKTVFLSRAEAEAKLKEMLEEKANEKAKVIQKVKRKANDNEY